MSLVGAGGSPQIALADCSGSARSVESIDDARGLAFEGILTDVSDVDAKGWIYLEFDIAAVLDGEAPQDGRLRTPTCYGVTEDDAIQEGRRYILTTSDPSSATSFNTIIWSEANPGWQLVGLENEPRFYPAEIRRARSRAGIIDLLSVDLPNTDVVPVAGVEGANWLGGWILGIGVTAGLGAALALRRMRKRQA